MTSPAVSSAKAETVTSQPQLEAWRVRESNGRMYLALYEGAAKWGKKRAAAGGRGGSEAAVRPAGAGGRGTRAARGPKPGSWSGGVMGTPYEDGCILPPARAAGQKGQPVSRGTGTRTPPHHAGALKAADAQRQPTRCGGWWRGRGRVAREITCATHASSSSGTA